MDNNQKLIDIIDHKISELQKEHQISDYIHNNWNFEKGLMIGMESIYEYITQNYELEEKEETLSPSEQKIKKNKELLDESYGKNGQIN